jgi:uncharacterized membrane protein
MSPAGLAKVFAALAAVVLAIGTGFAAAGAWLVLPFAGLEIFALVAAYVVYARRFDTQQEQVDKRLIRGTGT